MYRIAMKKPLVVLTVADQSATGRKGSTVEFLLFPSLENAKPQIQAEYDLASLGEVESVHGPFSDPPRWTVFYKGKVSAKKGAWIKPKD